MACRARPQVASFRCNVDTREIYRTSQLLSYLTGSFTAQQGDRGRSALPTRREFISTGSCRTGSPTKSSSPKRSGLLDLVLGKHSGRHALERRYRDLGYQLDDRQLQELYQEFIRLADRKREILDEDLLALVHESFHDAPEEYHITKLRVVCGSVPAEAEVQMTGPWAGERVARGSGDGPIAAAFSAISEILDRPVEVMSLSLRSVTPGRDSVGQVFLQARIGGKTMTGQGASTDIVEASARALVHSLNKERHAEVLEALAELLYIWGV